MSVAGAKGMLFDAMKTLRQRAERVRESWNDATRRSFEREEIETLEPKVAAALKAIDAVQELIRRVQRECGDDTETML